MLKMLRCQSHRIHAEESCQLGVEPDQEKAVCCSQKRGKRSGDLKTALTSAMEMQSLEFAQLVSCHALGITVN